MERPGLLQRLRTGAGAMRRAGSGTDLVIDHPPSLESRWGHRVELPAALVDAIAPATTTALDRLSTFVSADLVRSVPADAETGPYWNNGWISPVDASTIVGMVGEHRPKRVVEIGSGNSTYFFDLARRHHDCDLQLTSIDPRPRRDVETVADRVLREPLERVDQRCFAELEAGDVVFFDGSHRVLTDSDCVVMFCEVLPALTPGVIVHVHDVFLPWDYPPEWRRRHYSEQYLVATMLLFDPSVEVLAANHHLSRTEGAALEDWWAGLGGPSRRSDVFDTSLWFRRRND